MGRLFAGAAYRGMISTQMERVKADRDRKRELFKEMTLDERIERVIGGNVNQPGFRPGYRGELNLYRRGQLHRNRASSEPQSREPEAEQHTRERKKEDPQNSWPSGTLTGAVDPPRFGSEHA